MTDTKKEHVNAGVDEANNPPQPTPTQAENDAARLRMGEVDGQDVDASDDDDEVKKTRAVEAEKPATYKTKSA